MSTGGIYEVQGLGQYFVALSPRQIGGNSNIIILSQFFHRVEIFVYKTVD